MVKTVGKYDLYGTLGEGAFGKVKYAVNTETNEAVAIKILDKDKIQARNMGAQIKKEISIMKMINHHHVVSVKDVFATSAKIFIVLEFVGGGELFDKIANEGKLPEEKARFYFRQLVDGLEHCHNNGICHRDLKPENLLLDTDGNLKISDFGFSTLSVGDADGDGGTRAELLHTTCGTPNYVAPEVLGKDGYDGKKADVWSVGVILYVLLAGYLPFDENTMAALFSKIKSADYEFPDWFSPEARDLIAMILVPDPNKRPRISDIKNHIWMMKGDSGPTPMPPTNHAANHGAPPNVNPVNNYGNAATHMPTTPTPPATATATVHPPAAPSTPQQQPPSSAAVAAANIQSPRPPQQQPQQSQQPAPAAAAPAVATSQSVHTEKAAAAAQPAVTTATSSHHKHQEKQTAPQVDAGCCGWASHGKKK
jgi:5'-AMP-activated protein kinase catalytic alpha subunit